MKTRHKFNVGDTVIIGEQGLWDGTIGRIVERKNEGDIHSSPLYRMLLIEASEKLLSEDLYKEGEMVLVSECYLFNHIINSICSKCINRCKVSNKEDCGFFELE